MKITNFEQAEAAVLAALEFYKKQIREAVARAGSARILSKQLGYNSDRMVSSTLQKGKFSSIRRMAHACKK